MSFVPSFSIDSVVGNADIVNEFKCGNMGGMRRSKQTDTLVIISDHTKGLDEDKWYGDILHYTGMGKSGDQELHFMQNRTLNESKTNGIDVHLFEVLKAGNYIYKGPIELSAAPYQETQKGEDGLLRKVWMFPVKLKLGETPVDQSLLEDHEEKKRQQARKLSTDVLKQRATDNQSKNVSVRCVKSMSYIRDPYVSEYAKRIADGKCQLCGDDAPFTDNEGKPYLETHHIEWLSKGGSDTIENTVALCPNCHRKMHVLNSKEDIERLRLINVNG